MVTIGITIREGLMGTGTRTTRSPMTPDLMGIATTAIFMAIVPAIAASPGIIIPKMMQTLTEFMVSRNKQ